MLGVRFAAFRAAFAGQSRIYKIRQDRANCIFREIIYFGRAGVRVRIAAGRDFGLSGSIVSTRNSTRTEKDAYFISEMMMIRTKPSALSCQFAGGELLHSGLFANPFRPGHEQWRRAADIFFQNLPRCNFVAKRHLNSCDADISSATQLPEILSMLFNVVSNFIHDSFTTSAISRFNSNVTSKSINAVVIF